MQKTCYVLAILNRQFEITDVRVCGEPPWLMTRNLRVPAPLIVLFVEALTYDEALKYAKLRYSHHALAAKFPVESL